MQASGVQAQACGAAGRWCERGAERSATELAEWSAAKRPNEHERQHPHGGRWPEQASGTSGAELAERREWSAAP